MQKPQTLGKDQEQKSPTLRAEALAQGRKGPLGWEGLTIRLLRRSVELLVALNPNISLPTEKLNPCGCQNFPKNSADGLALRAVCRKAKSWVLLSLLVSSMRNRSHQSLTKYLGVL